MPHYMLKLQTQDQKYREEYIEAKLQSLVDDGVCLKWDKEDFTYYSVTHQDQPNNNNKGTLYVLTTSGGC